MGYDSRYSGRDFYWGLEPCVLVRDSVKYLDKGSRVLDLGCGEGKDSFFLAREGFDVSAVDVSEVGVEKLRGFAKNNNLNVKTEVCDVGEFLDGCGEFGGIFALNVLQFLGEDVFSIVGKMKSKARSGGLNVISSFVGESEEQREDALSKGRYLFDEGELKEMYKVSDLRHLYRRSSKGEFREWLKDRDGWVAPDVELFDCWVKYVHDSYAYRTQTKEHLKEILRDGFDPNYCPYVQIRSKLEKFYNLILKLEKKGYRMTLDWKGVYPSGSEAVRVSRRDLDNPFVDFAIDLKETRDFVKRFKGGAIAGNVLELVEGVKGFDVKLTKPQKKNINELIRWAKKKMSYSNFLMRVKLSSKCFEKAKIHILGEVKYWKSSYGSFENFKKVIKKYGLEKYEPYLEKKSRAYVRVIDRIEKSEIEVIR